MYGVSEKLLDTELIDCTMNSADSDTLNKLIRLIDTDCERDDRGDDKEYISEFI